MLTFRTETYRARHLGQQHVSWCSKRQWLGLFFLSALVVSGGCSSRYSTQEAYTVCQQRLDRVDGDDADIFAACVACYEDCGGSCEQQGSSFSCPH